MISRNPQHKVNNDSQQQRKSQDTWPISIIKATLSSLPNTFRPPVKGDQCIYHSSHCYQGEQAGGDTTDGVAKVEEANSQTAKDDGEVEP